MFFFLKTTINPSNDALPIKMYKYLKMYKEAIRFKQHFICSPLYYCNTLVSVLVCKEKIITAFKKGEGGYDFRDFKAVLLEIHIYLACVAY